MLIEYYNLYDSKTEFAEKTPEEIREMFKYWAWLDNVIVHRGVIVLKRPQHPIVKSKEIT